MKRLLTGLLFCLLVAAWIILLIVQQPPEIAGDFYPIYFGTLKLLAGQDPYTAEASREMARLWLTPYAAGFPYPLPMALICIPLALLPLPLSMWLWTLAGAAGSFAALGLRPDWRKLIFLPLVFAPLYISILVKQGTLVWFALIILFLFSMRWRRSWLIGLCIALLPIKPQVGLFFALAGLVWAWKNDHKSLYWAGLWSLLVWGTSFVLMPTWPLGWLEELKLYRAVNPAPSLLPWSLILILVTWRMGWPARLATAQVAIFPLNSLYTLLPLLLVWMEIGGPLALIGAGISMLWLAFPFERSAAVLWALTGAPLLICAAWRWRQSMQQSRLGAKHVQLEHPE
jgi:hypothetical protein